MTVYRGVKEKRETRGGLSMIIFLLIMSVMLLLGDGLKRGVKDGIDLCLTTIIPTLFPFFILSDYLAAVIRIDGGSRLCKVYEGLFSVSSRTLPAFLLGNICGFPLGVKYASQQYREKEISIEELEGVCMYSSNPSCAFVISGVGAGLLGDIKLGFLLYFSIVLSAIISGIILRKKASVSHNTVVKSGQSFNFVESVKSAGTTSILVSSYIIFFSALIGLIAEITPNELLIASVSSLLELSNAARRLASLGGISPVIRYTLIAFSLGYSGLSVHMQTFALLPKEMPKTRYILSKLLQGVLCATIAFITLSIEKAVT